MSTPAGWYPQPDGERLYWDGHKYSAAWAEEVGAVPYSGVGAGPTSGGSVGDKPAYLGGADSTREMRMPPAQVAAKGFFASLFDFGFTSFITLKLLSVVYGLLVVLSLLAGVVGFVVGISRGGTYGVIAILVVPVVTLIYLVLIRVSMEMVALFFRIGENTNLMAASTRDAGRPTEVVRTRRVESYSGLDGPY